MCAKRKTKEEEKEDCTVITNIQKGNSSVRERVREGIILPENFHALSPLVSFFGFPDALNSEMQCLDFLSFQIVL